VNRYWHEVSTVRYTRGSFSRIWVDQPADFAAERRGVVSPRDVAQTDRQSVGLHCPYCEHSCRRVLAIQLATIPSSPRESFPVGKHLERPWTFADVRVAW
jgi:hypothetical protein